PESQSSHEALAIAFLRAGLERRYAPEALAGVEEFAGISAGTVAAFQAFVLGRVYPDPEERRKLNEAFETLHHLLHSPGRLRSLLSVALSAFWRLGRRLPAAAQAGRLTLETFEKVRRVEELVARAFQDAGISASPPPEDKRLFAVLAPLPKEPFLELADALTALLRALSDESVLHAGLELTRTLESATAKNPAKWTAQERDGLRLARETLEEATAIFSLLPPDRRPTLIQGIARIEKEWANSLSTG
ncbi:MAG TPA: hypothetical protein PLI98_14450, partial [Candidatus Hydrogenedentes bacterium]|nr:hypothetical protein [Candidatus Hydrogenedentota bacterium]